MSPPDFAFDATEQLPAILVGQALAIAPRRARGGEIRGTEMALWFVETQHQFGGHACERIFVAGALMPLATAPHSRDGRDRVLAGLAALGSDDALGIQRSGFSELGTLHLHSGPYHAGHLGVLEKFLSTGFDLPRILRGSEAFVELADCDPLNAFGGWPVFRRDRPEGSSGIDEPSGLGAEILRAVERRSTGSGKARAFLLWHNSD